uniref:Uncharacterized protein n=1 Tax=Amphimedon queenslandica TaxID=400682 RepID=A0A1X7TQP1_AMPQE
YCAAVPLSYCPDVLLSYTVWLSCCHSYCAAVPLSCCPDVLLSYAVWLSCCHSYCAAVSLSCCSTVPWHYIIFVLLSCSLIMITILLARPTHYDNLSIKSFGYLVHEQ